MSTLTVIVKGLENQLQDDKEIFDNKLMEERGWRLEETRQLTATLCVKENEVSQLRCKLKEAVVEARKIQERINSMTIIMEISHVENEKASSEVRGLQD